MEITAAPTTHEYPNPAEAPEPTGDEAAQAAAAEAAETDAPKGKGVEGSEGDDSADDEGVEVETPAVVAKAPPVAPQIAAIKQRETAAAIKERDLAAREAALNEKSQKFSAESLKKNPTLILKEAGITLQEIAEAVVAEGNQPEKTPGEIALEKIQKLEDDKKVADELAAKNKTDSEQLYIDKAVQDHRGIVNKIVAENPDKWEMIATYEQQDLVTDIVIEHWKQNSEMLDIEKALEIAENYLLQRTEKAVATNKIKQKFQPAAPTETNPTRSLARTLSNSMASAPDVSVAASSGKRLGRDERLKRAASKIVIRPD